MNIPNTATVIYLAVMIVMMVLVEFRLKDRHFFVSFSVANLLTLGVSCVIFIFFLRENLIVAPIMFGILVIFMLLIYLVTLPLGKNDAQQKKSHNPTQETDEIDQLKE